MEELKRYIECPVCKNTMYFTRQKGEFNLYICNKCRKVYEVEKTHNADMVTHWLPIPELPPILIEEDLF